MPKVFQFSLQKVLNLREMVENTRAQKLKKSQAVLKNEQTRLNDIKNKKADFFEGSQTQGSEEQISITDLQISQGYLDHLNKKIEDQTSIVSESLEKVAADRQEVLAAAKEKMILDKLKERQQSQHQKTLRKKEIQNGSELALQRHKTNQDS